jgi:uncharacterized protein (TIGR03089 family)
VSLPATLPALLRSLLASDPGRPLLTYYDDAGGERVELSGATFDNAVAKTANLVQDEVGAESGETICLLLPAHWQSAVWVFAAAACGLRVVDEPAGCDVVVCHPETLETATGAGAGQVVATALRPLGGPWTGDLPAGVVDHGAEAPGQPDDFVAIEPVTAQTSLFGDEDQQTVLRAAAEKARSLGLEPGARVLTERSPTRRDDVVVGLLAPWVAGGSVVLVRHADPELAPRRAAQEQVTTTV